MKISCSFCGRPVVQKIFLGFCIAVGIISVTYAGYCYFREPWSEPVAVRVSNITSRAATVSWVSEEPTKGYVAYSEKNDFLPGGLARISKNVAYDDRDVVQARLEKAQREGEKLQAAGGAEVDYSDIEEDLVIETVGEYYVHHVTVRGLEPETTYYFRVGNGMRFVTVEEDGGDDSFTTYAELAELGVPSPAYGLIKFWGDEGTSVTDGVVYMELEQGDDVSGTISSVLSNNGSWYVDLSSAQTVAGTAFLSSHEGEFTEVLTIETGQYGKYVTEISSDSDAPADVIRVQDPEMDINQPTLELEGYTIESERMQSQVVSKIFAMDCTDYVNPRSCSKCNDSNASDCDQGTNFDASGNAIGSGYMQYCAERCSNVSEDWECGIAGSLYCEPRDCARDKLDENCQLCSDHVCVDIDATDTQPPAQEEPAPDGNYASSNCESSSPKGQCLDKNKGEACPSGSHIEDNRCPGDQSIKCCVKDSDFDAASATSACERKTTDTNPGLGGTCYDKNNTENSCSTDPVTNKCPGGTNMVCCTGNITTSIVDGSGNEVAAKQCQLPEKNLYYSDPSCIPSGDSDTICSADQSCEQSVYHPFCYYCKDSPPSEAGSCKKTESQGYYPNNSCIPENKDISDCPEHCTESGVHNNCYYCASKSGTGTSKNDSISPNKQCTAEVANADNQCRCTFEGNEMKLDIGEWCFSTTNECESGVAGAICSFTGKTCCKHSDGDLTCDLGCKDNDVPGTPVPAGSPIPQPIPAPAPTPSPQSTPSPTPPQDVCSTTCVSGESPAIKNCGETCNSPCRCYCSAPYKKKCGNVDAWDTIGCGATCPAAVSSQVVTRAMAQSDVQSDTDSIVMSPSEGIYAFEQAGLYCTDVEALEYCFDIASPGPKRLYIDVDQNGEYSTGDIDLATDIVELSVTKEYSTHTYTIRAGFNLISFDIVSSGADGMIASEVLAELNDTYSDAFYSISKFENGRWVIVGNRDGQIYMDEDFQLIPGRGYLLKSKVDVSMRFSGQQVVSAVPVDVQAGWNLIAVHGTDTSYTASSLIDSIDAVEGLDADNVTEWDATISRYQGLQKEEDSSGNMQEYGFDFPIDAKLSYFVRIVTGSGIWTPE